jgi:hypothetical protein
MGDASCQAFKVILRHQIWYASGESAREMCEIVRIGKEFQRKGVTRKAALLWRLVGEHRET